MISGSFTKSISILALVGFLAACESSEDRAEKHYQSGLALLEQGDKERALVEFRNVFDLNGNHREARQTYARIVREMGRTRDSYGQYLRLVEQYPDDIEGRIALSEMSAELQAWNEFDRHAERAMEAAPEDPRVTAIAVQYDYRAAILAKDDTARKAAFARAVELTKAQPKNLMLQRIMIDGNVQDQSYGAAIKAIDASLEQTPDDRVLHETRLRLLGQLRDADGVEAQLKDMITRFPDDEKLKGMLLQYYMSQQQPEKAEGFLRDIADPNAEDPALYVSLVQFLSQQQGPQAAIAELDSVIGKSSNDNVYRALRASLIFEQGERDAAIADMQEIVKDMPASGQRNRIRVNLARMLLQTGNEVGARQLVEQVLAEDSSQVGALRMQAAWQIDADDTSGAIASLRTALDQAPQDVQSMTLMSNAYIRAGKRNLANDFMSLAVEASGQAPEQSVRYARFLAADNKLVDAEQTLTASLRKNRGHPQLLLELGQIYLQMNDMARLRQVIAQVREIDQPEIKRGADALETALIERESGSAEAIAHLEEISKDWDDEGIAKVALIRARIAAGDQEGALASARSVVAEDPENLGAQFLLATTLTASGKFEEAKEIHKKLLDVDPATPRVWLQQIRIAKLQQDNARAESLLAEGLAANPDSADLLWVKAGNLEHYGDIDGAIAIYEKLYAQNTGSVVLANNLASLLSSYRDDEESLARAGVVAARLKGINQPAFQDTWGWIALLQGKTSDALTHLEPAATGLPNDPLVQYHLGRAYEAANRLAQARKQYARVIELAAEDDTRDQIADARARLEALPIE